MGGVERETKAKKVPTQGARPHPPDVNPAYFIPDSEPGQGFLDTETATYGGVPVMVLKSGYFKG